MNSRHVCIAVPVPIDANFSYLVPGDWPVVPGPGTRVLVPFSSRVVVGVVRPPRKIDIEPSKIRELIEVLDEGEPALPEDIVQLCEWISEYYFSPAGEVYRMALPGLLTRVDARHYNINQKGLSYLQGKEGGVFASISPQEFKASSGEMLILHALVEAGDKGLGFTEFTRIKPRISGVSRCLGRLTEFKLCEMKWADDGSTRARKEEHYRRSVLLCGPNSDESELARLLGRSKQKRNLLDFLEVNGQEHWWSLSEIRAQFPQARKHLRALRDAKLVEVESRLLDLDPFADPDPVSNQPQCPTEEQKVALIQIAERTDSGQFHRVLLQGITGSGKTEIYLQAIARIRKEGGTAIVLVPEIALTPQLADRFRGRFPGEVAVLHSGLNAQQRLDAWEHIRRGLRPIVIGARSALFAPLRNLRMIVVDEEHDASFKQDEGVRYHARDMAMVRAQACCAVVVLGSATPSLESLSLADQGRHHRILLNHRPTARSLPEVEAIDLCVHQPDRNTLMSARMRDGVLETVRAGEQAILFLNRRGYTTALRCNHCGESVSCPDCPTTSMTYHLGRNRLLCHLCGHIESVPLQCPQCKNGEFKHLSGGTERIEFALAESLPDVRVLRLDRDTSRGRRLLQVLTDFREHKADVLVGTQMLSKGHDFPNVTLVGILQADHGLGMPDPRAAERVFQLLTQVAGRAGRGERPGRVLVQSWSFAHHALSCAIEHDFNRFAQIELQLRKSVGNPPAGFMIMIRGSGLDEPALRSRMQNLSRKMHQISKHLLKEHMAGNDPENGGNVRSKNLEILGPVPSPIERINRRYRWQLLLRGNDRQLLRKVVAGIRDDLGPREGGIKQTQLIVDCDPYNFM